MPPVGITASVGYKFAVIEVTYLASDAIDQNQVPLQLPPVRGLLENGTISPWVGDTPLSGTNRAIFHIQALWTMWDHDIGDSLRPPSNITMVGWANCSGAFSVLDEGFVLTREIVRVANLMEDTDEHFMTSKQGKLVANGWYHRLDQWEQFKSRYGLPHCQTWAGTGAVGRIRVVDGR